VYPPLLGKSRTHVKSPLHTDQVIFRLRRRAGPKELFALKGIRTLDLMELPQRPRPLPLEPTPWGWVITSESCDYCSIGAIMYCRLTGF
jgi:hypothetical protein